MTTTSSAKRAKRKRPSHKRKRARPHRQPGVRNAEIVEVVPAGDPMITAAPAQTTFNRVGYTAAGWGGAALLGAIAARMGYHPRTIAIVLGSAGVLALARAKDKDVQSLGAGAFGAGGSQLVLLSTPAQRDEKPDDKPKDSAKQERPQPPAPAQPSGRQAAYGGSLAPGALDAAFERARAAVAVDADGHDHEHAYY
jgi:hypothetical protein